MKLHCKLRVCMNCTLLEVKQTRSFSQCLSLCFELTLSGTSFLGDYARALAHHCHPLAPASMCCSLWRPDALRVRACCDCRFLQLHCPCPLGRSWGLISHQVGSQHGRADPSTLPAPPPAENLYYQPPAPQEALQATLGTQGNDSQSGAKSSHICPAASSPYSK